MRLAKELRETHIQTLWGPEKIKYTCNTCNVEKEVTEFYCDSHNPYRSRSQCKVCWNKHNGRSNFREVDSFEVKK